MGKPDAPPPPDYIGLANAQGAASKDVAVYNSNVNRVNQFAPQGSSTWTLRPGADMQNPQPGDYVQTTSLSPEQQNLYNLNNQISSGFLGSGIEGLDRVNNVMKTPFDISGSNPLATGAQARALPGTADDSSRRRVEEAMLARLNPQFAQDEESLRTRLLNSGVEMGTEGWNREMTRLDQAKNDARQQAVLAGGQEESRQVGLNQGLQGQEFAQALQNAGFGNQARQQGIQEQSYLRQLPINEINALRTGSQMQGPQFSGYYTGGQAQAAPLLDAGIAQGNYDMNAYQNQQAGYNALLGGLASLGGAGITKYSDIRLKTNIKTIGMHPSGVRRVSWDWKDGSGSDVGVIAQELQAIRPDAVVDFGGYLAVRYDLIGGQ